MSITVKASSEVIKNINLMDGNIRRAKIRYQDALLQDDKDFRIHKDKLNELIARRQGYYECYLMIRNCK